MGWQLHVFDKSKSTSTNLFLAHWIVTQYPIWENIRKYQSSNDSNIRKRYYVIFELQYLILLCKKYLDCESLVELKNEHKLPYYYLAYVSVLRLWFMVISSRCPRSSRSSIGSICSMSPRSSMRNISNLFLF